MKPKKKPRTVVSAVIKYIILILWACTTIIPLVWVLNNSFKSSQDILLDSVRLAQHPTILNYRTVMSYPDVNILRAFLNSFLISGAVVFNVVVVAGLASFALGRMKVKEGKIIMAVLSACLLIPSFSTVIPNFVTLSKISFIRGTRMAAIIPQTAGNLCFSIIMLSGYMKSLPDELDDAALIDGASAWQIFRYVTMPLCKSMISTIAIMVFIWSYNDLFTSLVYITNNSKKPVCVILSMVSNMFGTDYGAMMAAIIITILPPLVLYVLAQEQVVAGMTAGAVKG